MEDTSSPRLPRRERGSAAPSDSPIRDLPVRLLLSPVFGIGVPTLTGLVSPRRHSALSLTLSFVTFSLVAFLVWEGNRRLHYRLSRREDWFRRPWHRVTVMLAVILGFTVPVSTALLLTWQYLFDDPGVSPYALPATVLTIVSLVAVITNIYETVFVLREWETARVRAAEEETARLAATLARLAHDVGPHFLFNNLSALQYLVERGDPRAAGFVDALSETYRYVLQSHSRPLVPLAEELDALERQRVLASARYQDQVRILMNLPADAGRRWSLPPAILGELLLNAVKHSRIDPAHPLVVHVSLHGDVLCVANAVSLPATAPASTSTGLANMAERVRICTGRLASWGLDEGQFVVRIPLRPA